MIKIEENSGIPIYLQIISGIKREILRGIFGPEERLPSIRELAIELRVNPNTIAKAYQEMETQGVIYFKRGQGAFVAPKSKEDRMNEAREEIIKLSLEILSIAKSLGLAEEEVLAIISDQLKKAGTK